MGKIVYTGDDFRVLASADLQKAGVEGFTKTSFANGVAVEVDDAVAEALINDPATYGKFETAADEEETEGSSSKNKVTGTTKSGSAANAATPPAGSETGNTASTGK